MCLLILYFPSDIRAEYLLLMLREELAYIYTEGRDHVVRDVRGSGGVTLPEASQLALCVH